MSKVETYIVAIDFDGTLVQNTWPVAGPDQYGAVESIKRFLDLGIKIVIWTCRTAKPFPPSSDTGGINEVVSWLTERGLYHHVGKSIRINENFPEVIEAFGTESRKIFAHCYIDDRNVGGFLGWEASRAFVYQDHDSFMAEMERSKNATATT